MGSFKGKKTVKFIITSLVISIYVLADLLVNCNVHDLLFNIIDWFCVDVIDFFFGVFVYDDWWLKTYQQFKYNSKIKCIVLGFKIVNLRLIYT